MTCSQHARDRSCFAWNCTTTAVLQIRTRRCCATWKCNPTLPRHRAQPAAHAHHEQQRPLRQDTLGAAHARTARMATDHTAAREFVAYSIVESLNCLWGTTKTLDAFLLSV